ncbi:uncharacterized protein PHALS_06048 [Plasmopara halstedii]|uniref:Uncharacterized protein n=1 Tax=Plasmopara halstedii TaxID=4781 RepID=A0A0P1ACG3_PLAHL|nr:uncharacterized protein PHALS_06048 [Plasmopara halstedii]CEG38006.1 hypothetical protein PHALS_06048 [Plasmopara halstedii]|eukprot:XP_024574375.1 hypothetical protein PHALS_06048 [Plasmopara halstedii]
MTTRPVRRFSYDTLPSQTYCNHGGRPTRKGVLKLHNNAPWFSQASNIAI